MRSIPDDLVKEYVYVFPQAETSLRHINADGPNESDHPCISESTSPDAGKISWTGRASEVWMRRADLPEQSPKNFEKKGHSYVGLAPRVVN